MKQVVSSLYPQMKLKAASRQSPVRWVLRWLALSQQLVELAEDPIALVLFFPLEKKEKRLTW